ncbi:hypothetical protein A3SI_03885 [Nitritalea halalkaliphila LW7]|uniref:Uncharacterized protein n=1 Tax=Nitritalea halalkaliphila LW7 TaxID=1189621 RepID=I5C981_9BACT|nr:hypothetical protein A3SI_03885 [Nitritalea halalkaliphila LW7]
MFWPTGLRPKKQRQKEPPGNFSQPREKGTERERKGVLHKIDSHRPHPQANKTRQALLPQAEEKELVQLLA